MSPALDVVGVAPGVHRAAGMYMLVMPNSVKFIADATVNIDPDAKTLAETAILAADMVRSMDIEPRVAMLSYANFGAVRHPTARKVRDAVGIVREQRLHFRPRSASSFTPSPNLATTRIFWSCQT
jgi:malate dehydrogenase (oxaloacetate-decarboxylating)(NADP+)